MASTRSAAFGLEPGRPIRPMLASSADDVAEAMRKAGPDGAPVAVDSKLDGIRIQVHRHDGRVRVFTRSLEEITDRVPEVVEAVESLPAATPGARRRGDRPDPRRPGPAVPGDRRPHRLAVWTSPRCARRCRSRRTSSTCCTSTARTSSTPPAASASPGWCEVLPPALVVPRTVTADPDEARRLFAEVVAAGHEGVVVKSLDAPYDAGRRGAGWVKVKPRHTLDLVVLAVEWGSGRRQGWLSNIHLGARDPGTGGFVMLGKTFKGMTDEMLAWQTERFLGLETGRDRHVVHVRPEQVVEIAFDGIQTVDALPRRAWRSGSPGCSATATTSPRTRRTRSTWSGRWGRAERSGRRSFRLPRFRARASRGMLLRADRETGVAVMNLFRTKTIEQSIADTEEAEHQLRKQLGPLQLTVFGVGVVIGTGIFVLTGEAAGEKAGPAVALSFVFAGHRLRAGGALLRRVRQHRAGRRVGVHVLLRQPRRAGRLDHRLGPDPRAGARGEHRRGRLVDLLRRRDEAGGDHDPRLGVRRGAQPRRRRRSC